MSKTSLTEAGQTKPNSNIDRTELIDAVNQVFALFRVNFHNQYYKAFPDDGLLNQVKKLWFESLQQYNATTILAATKKIIEESEYLPTLHQMLSHCAQTDSNAPNVHQAYVEACQAPSPKKEFSWSHPAVYEAGRRANWYFLSTTSEQFAFPVFKTHYLSVLSELNSGAQFEPPALENKQSEADKDYVSKEVGLKHIERLKADLNL